MNGWLIRALAEDLHDEGLREHIAWCARLLADRRRAQVAYDADELEQRKTDPSGGWNEAIEAGKVSITFERGGTSGPDDP